MADSAKIVIRVDSSRGGSTVSYSTKGRYVSFTTAGYQRDLTKGPIQPTASLSQFWLSVLGQVTADIEANP